MLNTRGLLTSLALAPLLMLACQTSDSGNNGNNGSGGHASGSGGAPGSGGSTNNGSGGNSSGSGGTPMQGSGGSGGSAGRDAGTDRASGSGGMVGSGGAKGSGGAVGSGGTTGNARCNAAGLNWKTGSKTNFQSYPDPGSVECIQFSGCDYVGQFAACPSVAMESKAWVMSHNIVAVFPQGNLFLHDLCLKSGSKTIVVTALDTCADSDCSGCCTENKGNADLLVDVEEFTDARWGVDDGPIQWADLGPTTGGGCN